MKHEIKLLVLYCLIAGLTLAISDFGSRAVTSFAEKMPIRRQHCIIIDPGHGGPDGGATSCTGIVESRFNLEIGLCLNDLLRFLGHDTRMVRREDISIYTEGETIARKKLSDLKQRVKLTEETENPILLSIHQNTFPDSRYSGAQVFYGNNSAGKELAGTLQRSFVTHLNPGSRRQEKKGSGIYLLEQVSCPAVLIECGFLSNPEEEAKLRSRDYQQKLSCVIASALGSFLSNT